MIDIKYMYSNQYTSDFTKFAGKNYYRDQELAVKCIKNGLFLPSKISGPDSPMMGYGGVLDRNGNYVMESAQIGKGDTKDRFIGKYEYDKYSEKFIDDTVIYIGAFAPHWGHFLVDVVYRCWYLLDNARNSKIVYCSTNAEMQGVYLDFFQLLGVEKERLLCITEPTRFTQIVIPEASYMACDYFTDKYRCIFQKVVENIPELKITPYEKIYMSRAHFPEARNKEIGEKNIEDNFRKNGFKVLYMEELSLAEQIYYINHSKVVAALSGTLCHNIVFADQNTELIILNKVHFINTHQVLINQMMGIKVTYVDVYKEPYKNFPTSYGWGPFLLDSSCLWKIFQERGWQYYKEKKMVVLRNRLIYVWLCLKLKVYTIYEVSYYGLCKHKIIIGILRKLKKAVIGN